MLSEHKSYLLLIHFIILDVCLLYLKGKFYVKHVRSFSWESDSKVNKLQPCFFLFWFRSLDPIVPKLTSLPSYLMNLKPPSEEIYCSSFSVPFPKTTLYTLGFIVTCFYLVCTWNLHFLFAFYWSNDQLDIIYLLGFGFLRQGYSV